MVPLPDKNDFSNRFNPFRWSAPVYDYRNYRSNKASRLISKRLRSVRIKPSRTLLGDPLEAETRRGNFVINLQLSRKRQESSSFLKRRKSNSMLFVVHKPVFVQTFLNTEVVTKVNFF